MLLVYLFGRCKLRPASVKFKDVGLYNQGRVAFSAKAHIVVDLILVSWPSLRENLRRTKFTVAGHKGYPSILTHTT